MAAATVVEAKVAAARAVAQEEKREDTTGVAGREVVAKEAEQEAEKAVAGKAAALAA